MQRMSVKFSFWPITAVAAIDPLLIEAFAQAQGKLNVIIDFQLVYFGPTNSRQDSGRRYNSLLETVRGDGSFDIL